MPLKIAHRKAEDVPTATIAAGSDEFNQIKAELAKLQPGMVLEVDAGSQKALRGTKSMLTRAGKQSGRPVQHWHQGTVVYAKTATTAPRRGRPPKVSAS
jgi:TusA-related sulfurtransferase